MNDDLIRQWHGGYVLKPSEQDKLIADLLAANAALRKLVDGYREEVTAIRAELSAMAKNFAAHIPQPDVPHPTRARAACAAYAGNERQACPS